MSLKQRTISALSWSACKRFSQQGIQFITIILARLLAPAEFGLIGMLTIFMAIAQCFVNSGFGQVGFLVLNLRANRTEDVSS
jgi:O-antigen/teichoic acid export membrane protein